uniref:Uncharacterized protein n=1 Tax=Leersia perrieri TaxID=77586 RepID=A0A0D9WK45_9ORYZ
MVLAPPPFTFPAAAARTRMAVPAYEVMFGKPQRRSLFEDYFDQVGSINSGMIMLRPLEDCHVDLTAHMTTTGQGEVRFRWQRDLDDPNTFMDLLLDTSTKPVLQLRSCAYYPKYRIGAFGTFPVLKDKADRDSSEDGYGVMGLRYSSENLSIGASFLPFALSGQVPYGAWLVGRKGNISAGIQYRPINTPASEGMDPFTDLKNWNCAISYGMGSTSPLSPSFNFSLELVRSTQLVASFYQHFVVQRRVLNPREEEHIVGTTNYVDFGLELATSVDKGKAKENGSDPLFQVAAGWQASKNFLVKGKLGPSKSSIALALKSWWRPFFTFSFTAMYDHLKRTGSYGFGISLEDLKEPSYQMADSNYVILTQDKEDVSPRLSKKLGKKLMFQSDIDSGNFDNLPIGLKPMDKIFKAEPPPPMVLVPPLFDYPPIAARTRMSVPAYELMFGKLSLQNLFEDYFDHAGNMTSRIMLKPLEDPHVDLIATVRSCAYYPQYRIGAFGALPLLMGNRVRSENYGVMGVRYGSENLSFGASFVPFSGSAELPFGAWLVGRIGSFTAGLQYKPLSGDKHAMPYTDLKNWNYAMSYGVGLTSPLSPSFIFSLELARNAEVKNPFEDDQIVGITNYIDFGLELATRIAEDKPSESANNSLFQFAASWQANKNFLFKGKLGPSKSSVALAFKSWWRPSFTFSVTAVNDHLKGTRSYGFGIRVEDLRQPSYQRADPNYVMLTPSKEHLAPGVLREYGERPMFQADIIWFGHDIFCSSTTRSRAIQGYLRYVMNLHFICWT